MNFRHVHAVASIALSVLLSIATASTLASEIGETVVVDVTGAAKNWETGTIISKDANGYTIRMLGVGEHKGEYHVPEHYIHGYHKNLPATTKAAPGADPHQAAPQKSTANTPTDSIKIGEVVLADVTGAAKNWESGKIISRDATGYTIEMLGVGEHKGQFHIPESYIHGHQKKTVTHAAPASTAASSGAASTPTTYNKALADASWKSLSDDIDARIKNSKNQGTSPGVPSAPAKAVSGSKGLNGLYLRHEQVFMGTSLSYNEDHYFFFPDGRFYHGVPPEGPSNFNWSKEQQAHPERCGQYGINGDKITISYSGSEPFTWQLKMRGANEMELNRAPTVRVERFGANARISGNYQRGTTFGASYSYAGAPTVTAAGTYIFNSNGTVSNSNVSGAEGDTKVSGVSVGVQQANQGTYSINGNDMTLNLGGKTMRCTVYPVYDRGNSQLPARISLNGALYERKK